MLLESFTEVTGDRTLATRLEAHARAAVSWMFRDGGLDGSGYALPAPPTCAVPPLLLTAGLGGGDSAGRAHGTAAGGGRNRSPWCGAGRSLKAGERAHERNLADSPDPGGGPAAGLGPRPAAPGASGSRDEDELAVDLAGLAEAVGLGGARQREHRVNRGAQRSRGGHVGNGLHAGVIGLHHQAAVAHATFAGQAASAADAVAVTSAPR